MKGEGEGLVTTGETYAIEGFQASAVASGLKKKGGLDLALILSEKEAAAAGVFTTNRVKAAPVLISRERVASGRARAILVNAGNANACTGREGIEDVLRSSELVAEPLGLKPQEVLVASTGVIGQRLPIRRIQDSVPQLVGRLSPHGLPDVASAIMTTDTFPKLTLYEGTVSGVRYRISGMAKGAGMIMPDMATMLSFVLTDLRLEAGDLRRMLLRAVERTFNRITVDGDTSTNDTVLILASGMAGNAALTQDDEEAFQQGLTKVLGDLARMVVQDGEGATKVVTVHVRGAASAVDALLAGRTVANSPLVKTAIHGEDPNWGRIMAALGRSGVRMAEEKVDIWVDDVQIVGAGQGLGTEAEARAAERMQREFFDLIIHLHEGGFEDRILTCDLSQDYIKINAEYRT